MKKTALLLLILTIIFVTGCATQYTSINDLRLGMQVFEAADIHQKPLVPIGMQSGQGCDLAQYQGWFLTPYNGNTNIIQVLSGSSGERAMPYKLTFEVYPPVTHEQCLQLAKMYNVTEPTGYCKVVSVISC